MAFEERPFWPPGNAGVAGRAAWLAAAQEAADGGHQLLGAVGGVRGVGADHAVTGVDVEQAERDLVEGGLAVEEAGYEARL